MYYDNSLICCGIIRPPRGVWGHAPPENFRNLDSLRTFLRHSDSHLGADLASSNFYLSTDIYNNNIIMHAYL